MIVKTLTEPVFNVRVTFIFDCPMVEVKKYFDTKKWGKEDDWDKLSGAHGSYFTLVAKNGATRFILWLEKKEDLLNLDHETVHLAEGILDDRGAESSGETLAYYKSYWFGKCCKILSKLIH